MRMRFGPDRSTQVGCPPSGRPIHPPSPHFTIPTLNFDGPASSTAQVASSTMFSPSAKALGKRKATPTPSNGSAHHSDMSVPEQACLATNPLSRSFTPNGVPSKTQSRPTRATRSSLGGTKGAVDGGKVGEGELSWTCWLRRERPVAQTSALN